MLFHVFSNRGVPEETWLVATTKHGSKGLQKKKEKILNILWNYVLFQFRKEITGAAGRHDREL